MHDPKTSPTPTERDAELDALRFALRIAFSDMKPKKARRVFGLIRAGLMPPQPRWAGRGDNVFPIRGGRPSEQAIAAAREAESIARARERVADFIDALF